MSFITDCINMFQTEVWLLQSELQNNFCKWIFFKRHTDTHMYEWTNTVTFIPPVKIDSHQNF